MVNPPVAPTRPYVRHLHGRDIPDDYAWMADGGTDLTDYLRAELHHYAAATAPLEPLRRRLFTEMVARTPLAEEGPAHSRGAAEFRDVMPDGAELGQFQRRVAAGEAAGEWATLVDLDVEAALAGSAYGEIGVREVSPDGGVLAWSFDSTGEELYELRFRDIASGADLPGRTQRTYYSGAWSADSRSFFYTVLDHVYRPHQVWRHEIGTDPSADVLVLAEGDRRFDLSVRATRCGQWVLIHASSRDACETWAIPAAYPAAAPATVGGRREGHEYGVESVPGGPEPFLAVTNHGGVREFTLCWLGLGDTDPAGWRPAVDGPLPGDRERAAHDPKPYDPQPYDPQPNAPTPRRFLSVDAFAGRVVITLRESGHTALYVVPVAASGLDWSSAHALRPASGGSIELGTNEQFDATFVTVVAQSRIDPPVWTDHPVDPEVEPVVRHRAQAPNHDSTSYVVTQHWVTARDGEQIPVTLVAHRVTALDGTAPCLLYGYGAYEYTVEPTFSRRLPSVLDRGVVWAHVHVRGGGELGRRWWDEGHMASKANSFRDFVDVARALGTGPDSVVDGSRIVSRGGSAGGLLVAASMDLDPEAFAGVIAEVPFVDVVNSMLDSELPLTVGEWEEWGNPALPEQFGWIRDYSPYDNVPPAGRRPFILATGAVHDPRVMVHEPAKWVARLRATDPQEGAVEIPGRRGGVLLRVALEEGSHGGAAGRFAALDEEAQTQAVILATMGING